MNKIAFIIIPLLVLACSVMPPPKLIEYRGPDVYEGKGGTVETVGGIDFWTTGTPNRKFKVLGYIEYTLGNIGRKFVISKVKEVGGDGVIIVDKETRASGIYDFMGDAHISYYTDYWMAVVKYLETGSEKLLNQGIALLEGGQYDRAIAIFDEALEINPRYAEAYNFRGVAYDEKGQYDKAISDCNKAIEINPGAAEAYLYRGVSYFYKKEYEKAWNDVHKVQNLGLQVDPEFLKALREASGIQK